MMGRPVLVLSQNMRRESGRKVQTGNINAAKTIADIIRTCLGPRAMMKMLLDPMGGIVMTNDGNAILREIQVQHPAAKSMIEISRTQDEEVGDGTTSVIILAGEMLAVAEQFLEQQMHPTVIISAYRKALDDMIATLNEISTPVDVNNRELMLKIINSAVTTKAIRRWADLACNIALDAVKTVELEDNGRKEFDIKKYAKVEKIPGGIIEDSEVLRGVMVNKDVTHPKMRRYIKNPRILLLDCSLEYKKGESQTEIEITREEDFSRILQMEAEVSSGGEEPTLNLSNFMKNIAELMDKLEVIQKKIGPLTFSSKESGLKGALMRLFEACCPLSRSSSDDKLWEEHLQIRQLLNDDALPKHDSIATALQGCNRRAAIEELMVWCNSQGADLRRVALMENSTAGGFGLVATEEIEPKKAFLWLPQSVLMVSEEFLQHEALSHLVSNDPVLSTMQNILLTYGLLMEFYRGEASPHLRYLRSLPASYQNAYYWEAEEMELLRGTTSFREALNSWKCAVRQYAYFHLKMLEYSASYVGGGPVPACSAPLGCATGDEAKVRETIESLGLMERFCYRDYRWAAATVMSRSAMVSCPNSASSSFSLVLTPVLDLCNHVDTIYLLEYDLAERGCRASLSVGVAPGAELMVFYGARTTGQLVLSHGFFFEENAHDFLLYRLPFDADDAVSCCRDEKHDLLLRLGLTEWNGFPLSHCNNVWSGDLLAYMRVYVASEEDISVLKAETDERLRSLIYAEKPLSQSNEDRAANCLHHRLAETLAELDRTEPAAQDRPPAAQLLLKLRLHERQLLSFVASQIAVKFGLLLPS